MSPIWSISCFTAMFTRSCLSGLPAESSGSGAPVRGDVSCSANHLSMASRSYVNVSCKRP